MFFSEMKMNIVDAQNACLSGGVAVGAIADLSLQPYGAVVIGSVAGILSTIGYQVIQVRIFEIIIDIPMPMHMFYGVFAIYLKLPSLINREGFKIFSIFMILVVSIIFMVCLDYYLHFYLHFTVA